MQCDADGGEHVGQNGLMQAAAGRGFRLGFTQRPAREEREGGERGPLEKGAHEKEREAGANSHRSRLQVLLGRKSHGGQEVPERHSSRQRGSTRIGSLVMPRASVSLNGMATVGGGSEAGSEGGPSPSPSLPIPGLGLDHQQSHGAATGSAAAGNIFARSAFGACDLTGELSRPDAPLSRSLGSPFSRSGLMDSCGALEQRSTRSGSHQIIRQVRVCYSHATCHIFQ